MNIAEIELSLEQWGDWRDPNSNWNKIKKAACFTHRDACEFIVHCGSKDIPFEEVLAPYDLNDEIKTILKEAYELNFNYVCFIA